MRFILTLLVIALSAPAYAGAENKARGKHRSPLAF